MLHLSPAAKPRINLKEYRFLEEKVAAVNVGDEEAAIQSVATYAHFEFGWCLKDEADAYRLRRATRPSMQVSYKNASLTA